MMALRDDTDTPLVRYFRTRRRAFNALLLTTAIALLLGFGVPLLRAAL